MAYQKRTILIILIIVVLLEIGGFFWWKDWKSPSPQLSQTQAHQYSEDFSEWKTYRNEEYGFEIKYPPTWKNCKVKENDLFYIVSTTNKSGKETKCYPGPLDEPSYSIKLRLESEIMEEYPDYQSFKNAILSSMNSADHVFRIKGVDRFEVRKVREIILNNTPVLIVDQIDFIGIPHTIRYVFHRGNLLSLIPSTLNIPEDPREREVETIISTFNLDSWKIVNGAQEKNSNHSQISISYPEIPSSTKKLPIFYRSLYKFIPILDKFFGKIIKLFFD